MILVGLKVRTRGDLIYLLGNHCHVCGERDHACLEIAHVFDNAGEESASFGWGDAAQLARGVNQHMKALEVLELEAFRESRILLCSNCHAKNTYADGKGSRPTTPNDIENLISNQVTLFDD